MFFGGEGEEHATVSQDAMFHMLDVMYGLSKEFDFNPNLEGMVSNTHDYDVKRSRGLIQKIAGADGMVDRREFIKLVRKTPALLMRIIAAQKGMRDDCAGTGFWRRMESQRQGMIIAKLTSRVEKESSGTLGAFAWKQGGTTKRRVKAVPCQGSSGRRRQVEAVQSRLDEEEDRAAMKMQADACEKDRKLFARGVLKKAAKEGWLRLTFRHQVLKGSSCKQTEPRHGTHLQGDITTIWLQRNVWDKPPGFVA